MRVFLDFEASSLAKHGYPIEVAWAFEDGQGESYLIRPAPDWTDWDEAAERIHRIPRSELVDHGEPVEAVAARMTEALGGHGLYASAPSWDGKWLSALLRAAGLPRHSLRLLDTEVVRREVAVEMLGSSLAGAVLEAAVADVLERAADFGRSLSPEHRALADARQEWRVVEQVRLLAKALLDQGR